MYRIRLYRLVAALVRFSHASLYSLLHVLIFVLFFFPLSSSSRTSSFVSFVHIRFCPFRSFLQLRPARNKRTVNGLLANLRCRLSFS